MKSYDTYKDSGISWLGQIPSHWKLMPGFSLFHENNEKFDMSSEPTVLSLSYGNIVVKANKNEGLVPENYSGYQVVEPNYIIIRCTDLQNDKVSLRTGISKNHGIITGAYLGLIADGINAEYLHYFLHDWDVTKEIYRHGSGLRQSLSWNDMKRLPILLPTFEEQEAIVSYLNHALAEIDQAIASQQRMVELLQERKQIIINEAVTRGINPDAPMKPTNIDWIPEIPAHWQLRRLGALGTFSKGSGISRDDLKEEGLPALLYGDIYMKYNFYTLFLLNHISEDTSLNAVRIKTGDILMTGSGETKEDIGKAVLYLGKEDAFVGGDVIIFKDKCCDSKFLTFVLNSEYARAYKAAHSKGEIVVHIYPYVLKNLAIPIPPFQEQISIAEHIDACITLIDQAIEKCSSKIDLLTERKQILINDVVTGKIKVL